MVAVRLAEPMRSHILAQERRIAALHAQELRTREIGRRPAAAAQCFDTGILNMGPRGRA